MLTKLAITLILIALPIYSLFPIRQSKNDEKLPDQIQEIADSAAVQEPKYKIEDLTLEKIFSQDHSWTDALPPERKIVIMATGDVLLARSVNYKNVRSGNFKWPFEKTADVLQSADKTFINLETPLIENCPVTYEGMIFCGDSRNIEGLLYAGVDVVNVANNHIDNYGEGGVSSTTALLKNTGLLVSGEDNIATTNIRGINFAFLGYNELDFGNETAVKERREQIVSDIKSADAISDIVVVQFHWGNEYTTEITEQQRALAHLAVDAGTDLIIGNHPHWVQPVEIYKGKFIAYAHGNFVFDQEWSPETKQGVVGKYTFFDRELVDVEFLPIQIEEYGQPRFISRENAKEVFSKLQAGSIN